MNVRRSGGLNDLRVSLEDEQRPVKPRIWDSEAIKEAAEQQLCADYQTHLALQRVLFIAT
jgi:hypothetical protein